MFESCLSMILGIQLIDVTYSKSQEIIMLADRAWHHAIITKVNPLIEAIKQPEFIEETMKKRQALVENKKIKRSFPMKQSFKCIVRSSRRLRQIIKLREVQICLKFLKRQRKSLMVKEMFTYSLFFQTLVSTYKAIHVKNW